MPVCKKSERVSARIPANVYETLTQAAEFTGATLNQFLVQSALEKAEAIIEKERIISMSMRSASVFLDAVENPPKPNRRLKSAVKSYKKSFPDAKNRNA